MSVIFRHIMPALALLTIASAQVFGMDRGFLCDCGGMEKITAADHCHGPHSAVCHEDEAEEPCHESSDGHHKGDTHEHLALIESLLASLSPALSFSAPAPIIMDLALEEWHTPLFLTEAPAFTAAHSEHPPPATHRPWPRLLAHTLILRI